MTTINETNILNNLAVDLEVAIDLAIRDVLNGFKQKGIVTEFGGDEGTLVEYEHVKDGTVNLNITRYMNITMAKQS